MQDLMNKVREARKADEANWIARREETAAIRSQAASGQPGPLRLRVLEVLEKIASADKLNTILGVTGLADKVVNLQ